MKNNIKISIGIIGALLFVGLVYRLHKAERFPGPLKAILVDESNIMREVKSTEEQEGDRDSAPLRIIAQNLNTPWSLVFYGKTPLVSSRNTGEIHEINEDGSTRVVGVVKDSLHRGEGGLLGLAVNNQHLYAYYTTATDNRITRFTINGEPGSLSLSNQEVLLSRLPSSNVHNGGRIAFGPDGMLYATVGDAGNTGASQEIGQLHGTILRMTPDGTVPSDNPFENSLVYSYGHRNPQGLAWAHDGTLYASEFGQNTWDELNRIEAGANYGWPVVEGVGGYADFIDPLQQWTPSEASPSGIAYANGMFFIANLRGASLRTVQADNPSTSAVHYLNEFGRIRDVAIAPDGRLWIVTNNTDGRGSPREGDDVILSIDMREF